jgi:ATP-binding cassette subfamily B (MDR/TAP) protein 1
MNNILSSLFDQHIAKARASSLRGAMVNAVGLGVMFFAIYAAYALAFVYGGILITQNRADSGIVITVFLSVLIGSFSMAMVNPELEAIGKARGAAAKIFETIERVPLIDSASDEGLKPDTVQGKIEFDRVTFTYPSRPDVPILKQPGLSLTFKAGETNALVGASGSGKSTIAALIMRFYDPTGGRVLLDGRDIRELNVRWLRQNIGLVSQEPTLFGRSVRANIETGLLGSPLENLPADEKLELVKAACIKANAHDFISELPNGYDTDVGERGMLLSGGQKQRVAIARAIISDPKVSLRC